MAAAATEERPQLPDLGESIDQSTFQQILDMDDEDEDDREFSKSIVFGFFEQATNTFERMDVALDQKDLRELSQLGHFLKGSSATLGLILLRNSCEKIQHLGDGKDETGMHPKDASECLAAIKEELKKLRTEYARVEESLNKFFGVSHV